VIALSSTSLCVVATPDHYQDFARELFLSAEEHFKPTEQVEYVLLDGPSGWPWATMLRHHVLLDNFPRTDYVFLLDADLLFSDFVGSEILPMFGTTAVQHPGYVGRGWDDLPYEKNPESAAYIWPEEGGTYFAGGFLGGTNRAMKHLSAQIVCCVELDTRRGYIPIWHDESCANRVLAVEPPEVVLSPAYLNPARNGYYIEHVWGGHEYPRKVTALDKTAAERAGR
jgi:hypothetical protein